MAWINPCEEVAKSKPLSMIIYATVIVGLVLSFFVVFSGVYTSRPPDAQISIITSPSSTF